MLKKCIIILLDGLGDRSHPVLGHQTPLQAARTPVLDRLAEAGASGSYHAAALGQALPSENAHFVLFGYDMDDFPGRGALEALGAGVDISPGDVALLSHFVSQSEVNGTLILDQGKPRATRDEIAALSDSIKNFETGNVTVSFHPTGGIRGILTMRGDVSPFITDSDPFLDGQTLCAVRPWQRFQQDSVTRNTARALTAYLVWVYGQLQKHQVNRRRAKQHMPPLNGLTTQRAGRLKPVTPFFEKYGLRGLILASGMVYWGLGAHIGMDIRKVQDTSDPGTDMEQRLHMAREALADYDFVHVHTKTPDEAAHTKDPVHKKEVIEALDAGIGRAIQPIADNPDSLVIVTADHSTPSDGPLIHSGESVPVVFHGRGVRRDKVCRFDEVSATQGALGAVRGRELMYLVLNHLDRSKLAGLMDTPVDQPYWPGHYEPFSIVNIDKKNREK